MARFRRGDGKTQLRDLADEELMALAGRGDVAAFDVIYDRHSGAAYSLAYRMAGKRGVAEDVVQEAFISLWRAGAFPGETPAESFFVRCDRTTMSQIDLDNGRLVCLVGFAPASPAEFVVFRIGHFTADRPDD